MLVDSQPEAAVSSPGYVACGLGFVRQATYSVGYLSMLIATASTSAGFSLSKKALETSALALSDMLGVKGRGTSAPRKCIDFIESTTMQGFHTAEVVWGSVLHLVDAFLEEYGINHEDLVKLANPGTTTSAFLLSTVVVTNLFQSMKKKGTIAQIIKGIKLLSAVHEFERQSIESEKVDHSADLPTIEEVSIWEWGFDLSLAVCGAQALKFLGFLPGSKLLESDLSALKKYTGIEDIVAANWSSDVYRPAHFVAVDHEKKSVVLSIRGTMQLGDLLTDLVCERADFRSVVLNEDGDHTVLQGKVHQGFLRSASGLSEELEDLVKQTLIKNPGYKLFLCGHSLGGGVATILTLLWAQVDLFRQRSIRCIAYGSPCSLCPELASNPFTKKHVTSLVIDDDFVSRLSLGSVTELFEHAIKLGQEESDDIEVHYNISKKVIAEAQDLKLYPGGKVHHLPCNSTQDPISFSRINISPTMFSVHMPNRYHQEILKVKETVVKMEKL